MTHHHKEVIQNALNPVLESLTGAVKRGQWEGIDGVCAFLQNPRITSLSSLYNSRMQREALSECFKHMIKIAEDAAEYTVIREFAIINPAVVMHCAESEPELFQQSPNSTRCCSTALKPAQQRKFNSLINKTQQKYLHHG